MFRLPAPLLGAVVAALLAIVDGRAADVTFRILDQKGQPVADAVVSLVSPDRTSDRAESSAATSGANPAGSANIEPTPTPAPGPEIIQRHREFVPFVTAVRVGTAIHFPNRDVVEHYVYSRSPAKPFQLPLYAPGKNEVITFDHAGVVALGCNIHDWMLAYVVVVNTPWFTQTSAAGVATIRGLPAGRYRAEVWHPRLRQAEMREMKVADGAPPEPLEFRLTLRPDHRIRRPPDASTGGYR